MQQTLFSLSIFFISSILISNSAQAQDYNWENFLSYEGTLVESIFGEIERIQSCKHSISIGSQNPKIGHALVGTIGMCVATLGQQLRKSNQRSISMLEKGISLLENPEKFQNKSPKEIVNEISKKRTLIDGRQNDLNLEIESLERKLRKMEMKNISRQVENYQRIYENSFDGKAQKNAAIKSLQDFLGIHEKPTQNYLKNTIQLNPRKYTDSDALMEAFSRKIDKLFTQPIKKKMSSYVAISDLLGELEKPYNDIEIAFEKKYYSEYHDRYLDKRNFNDHMNELKWSKRIRLIGMTATFAAVGWYIYDISQYSARTASANDFLMSIAIKDAGVQSMRLSLATFLEKAKTVDEAQSILVSIFSGLKLAECAEYND